MNSRLAHLQAAHHPAILRLIKLTVDAAHRHGKWVGLCGEMGSDPLALRLLDGLELDEISLHAAAIVRTRAALSRTDHAANVRLATHCLTLGSAAEVAAAVTA
jgi:phosphotransferase system enzyme I (PtsI)